MNFISLFLNMAIRRIFNTYSKYRMIADIIDIRIKVEETDNDTIKRKVIRKCL